MPACIPLPVVRWCAEECRRQRSGYLSVARLAEAWWYALTHALPFDEALILELGALVEPERVRGYRTIPVWAGFATTTPEVVPWEPIERGMANLVEAQDRLTPVEFYTEFERIHPFLDGNGRVGALLYNALNGTFMEPVAPPDVFWRQG